MIVSAIFAVSENNVIGKGNDLPWRMPADLKYFKKTTLGHPVIMGRKSFESIGRPLPGRHNIVLTRDPEYTAEGISVVHTLSEALESAAKEDAEEVFVIGGGQIYEKAFAFCDRLYITRIHSEVEGDVFLPELDFSDWNLISEENHKSDGKNIHDYTFCIYERI